MKRRYMAICLLVCFGVATSAYSAVFNMLSCSPGENSSKEARFVWHSDSSNCTFWYSKASQSTSAFNVPCAKIHKPVAFRDSDVDYWKYTAEIKGLRPNTEYEYWVESGTEKSPRQRFKTAGTGGKWNLLWMSDVHSHPDDAGKMKTVELLRQNAEERTSSSGGIDMVLFSGDMVKYGARYDNWQQWNGVPAVTNYSFATVPGNKEYYYRGSSSFYDYYWYLAVKNNPPNGPDTKEQEGCYWFLRDSVLFVGIDSLIHKGSRMELYEKKSEVLTAQTNWFDNVVSSQRGKFRYLVVFQHDPWFVYAATKNTFDKSRGNYDVWRHVFDKHKVDLALSGDEHNYIRTKRLRSDAENVDGTIYMVAGQIEVDNYSATVTTDISKYGNANATKYFDCIGATDASCGACWVEVRPEFLKLTYYWNEWQSPNYKVYDGFIVTPKNRGFEYVASTAQEGLWLNECAEKSWSTGEWSEYVEYGDGGRANFNGEVVFTPYAASTGNVVTVETTAQFCEFIKDTDPDSTAQAAVQLSTNGRFQVWTHLRQGYGGQAGWVDVEAEGVTPVSGAEYTLRFTFNYSNGTYSVDLKDNDRWIPLNSSTPNSSTHPLPQSSTSNFLLATATNCVSSISFVGDTLFTSLSGECRMVVIGFAQNETVVLKDNAVVILDAAKAAWLNKCAGGDKAAAGSAAANVSSKEFEEAYLLNLDIADGERSYSFAIAEVKVGDENVTVSVTLKRAGIAGGEAAPINGTLKFYGAATLEAFKNAGSAAIEAANLTDGDFSKSDTATATFPKGENKFFKAKIEE